MQYESSTILEEFLDISDSIIKEPDYLISISKIIDLAGHSCSAEAGFFYTFTDDKFLNLEYSYNEKLNIKKFGSDNNVYQPSIFIPESKSKQIKSAVETCIINNEVINLPNIYATTKLDNTFFANYDALNNYTSLSLLTLPLINRKGYIIGAVQYINCQDIKGKNISFTKDMQKEISAFCNLASLILENRKLNEDYGQLLESFIEVLARAIDAKSPYTGSHCQKVPIITKMLATAATEEKEGSLKDFEMSDDDWYALHIASWLHDCGKVTTPEYIVDKATKLETITNRIHEIRNRFEILRRDAHITYLQKRLAEVADKETLQAEFVARVKQLEDDFAFVAWCNTGDNEISKADQKRLEEIGRQTFTRYFNRMLGLSWAERNAVTTPEIYNHPCQEQLLQDRPDHLIDGYNRGELYNLKIPQGTINKEEREKINDHIVVTIDMLKALSFPKKLANVIEYAGCHHEWVNGKGYPNHLTGDQMSIPAKIIAIADVFEALTAKDRPYKEPKKLSQVLRIMQNMKNIGHLDPDLYKIFITHKVYMDYAEQYMDKDQIEDIDPEEYL